MDSVAYTVVFGTWALIIGILWVLHRHYPPRPR